MWRGRCRETIRRVRAELVTERLALRRFTADDVDELVVLDGDPRAMRFLDRAPRSRAQIEAGMLPRFLSYYSRYGDFGFWAAQERRGGGFLGGSGCARWCLLPLRWCTGRTCHLARSRWQSWVTGFRASAWGQGYATEEARTLVRRAFIHLALGRIVATSMAVSTRSRRVLERPGSATCAPGLGGSATGKRARRRRVSAVP